MRRFTRAALLISAPLAFAAAASAQEINTVPAGAPAPGSEVQIRYSSPGALNNAVQGTGSTQQSAQPIRGSGENPYHAIQQRRAGTTGAEGGEGAESSVRDPFSSSLVAGVGAYAESGPLFVTGAEIYRGITPTANDSLPHLERLRRAAADPRRPNSLTWVGFQPFDDFARVFVQTGRAVDASVLRSPDGLTITLRLPNTAIGLSNFHRSLETAWFGRAVTRVRTARGPSGATDVVIELADDVEYDLQEISSGADYVFLNFRDRE
jgi:hypothetical protein